LTGVQWLGTGGLGISLLLVWFEKPHSPGGYHPNGILGWLQPPDFPSDFYNREISQKSVGAINSTEEQSHFT